MTDQSSLYGKARQKKQSHDAPSASNLAFTTQLSSLIAQDSTSSHSRQRQSKPKSGLFGKANKGAEKRAAADLQGSDHHEQKHQSSHDIGTIDDATLGRSKRRMDEKARIYNDIKLGSHLAGDDHDDDIGPEDYLSRLRRKEREGLVDFDRKWADEERKKMEGGGGEFEEEDDGNASTVSYEDEFGRSRRGTRAEAARAARTKEEEQGHGRSTQERWKPARPDNLIYGATVQSEAFNPDANVATQMAQLAARRDRSPTPPENVHYNADGEVRNRGQGFYAFSKDENERNKQMEELRKAREETEKWREKRKKGRAAYQAIVDDRYRQIAELQQKRLAERFMEGLPADIAAASGTAPDDDDEI